MAQEPGPALAPMRRVAVLGAGGLGAAYGSRFFAAPGFDAMLVADGSRGERLRAEGLVVNGRLFHIPVAVAEEGAEPADLILVALKQYHLAEALPLLRPFVGQETVIISVLNGLDSEIVIGEIFGKEKVLYSIVLGIDAVRTGNVINYSEGGKLFFGEIGNETISARVRRVQEALGRAGIPFETPPDMRRTMWRKFMINVGINQASAVLARTLRSFPDRPGSEGADGGADARGGDAGAGAGD